MGKSGEGLGKVRDGLGRVWEGVCGSEKLWGRVWGWSGRVCLGVGRV